MRESMKKRLAVFLTLLMILPAIAAVLPMTATEVQAAAVSMWWDVTGSGTQTIKVEKGQKFYVGDYVAVYEGAGEKETASMKKASYSSSKTSVATVNSKGYFTAKKTGSTTITVKYKGQKIKCKFQVVAAGSFKNSKAASGLKKKAAALAKSIPSKVSTKNGFDLVKKRNAYQAAADEVDSDISFEGFLKENVTSSYYKEATSKLAVPQAGRYLTICAMLNNYGTQNSPTSTRSARVMKISSASATAKTITVKLKKNIDTAQILAAQIQEKDANAKVTGKTKANIRLYIYNTKTNEMVYGLGVIQKGSKTMKITPQKYVYNNGLSYVNTTLEKGTYRLGSKTDWTKGKTVTVK